MNFDHDRVPFSRYGSFFVISSSKGSQKRGDGVYVRNVRGGDSSWGELFRVEPIDDSGNPLPYQTIAFPWQLQLVSEPDKLVSLCFSDPHVLRIRTQGVGIRLAMETGSYDYAFQAEENGVEINSFTEEIRLRLTTLAGTLALDAPWDKLRSTHICIELRPHHAKGIAEAALEEYVTVWKPTLYAESFTDCLLTVEAEYRGWIDRVLPSKQEWDRGRELAAYITWSSVVNPSGMLTRPAMYMSKNWMTNIWSWDHCFNAMALVQGNPSLAYDQIMLFFDTQDESGVLADFLNDKHALWNCSKPPIHGWALRWMMERSDFFTADRLAELYQPLARWTGWWLAHRRQKEDGLFCYHHGNDSGWDNSTVFAKGVPVESPDLAAYLCLQMETLAVMAERLGQNDEARSWHKQSDQLLLDLLQRFWTGEKFIARLAKSGEAIESDSLLPYLPIVLGKRLPIEVKDKLVAGLKAPDSFLTAHGFATERTDSSSYLPDGYWRGPIWAPSTMLIVDGLHKAGETELAREIASRFCLMAQENGMAENFNAMTGQALRDPAFTWTSSVYLILAHEYV